MPYERRSGDISLFYETDKRSPKSPDYRGKLLPLPCAACGHQGEEQEAAMWVKQGQRGEFLSGRVQPKRERREEPF